MFTDIFKKRELRENMYSAKMSTFIVFHLLVHVIIHNIIVSLSYGPVPKARTYVPRENVSVGRDLSSSEQLISLYCLL